MEIECSGNEFCMSAIALAIKNGLLPLTAKGSEAAWSNENPYRD